MEVIHNNNIIEDRDVWNVYNKIAFAFSITRANKWDWITSFVTCLPKGCSILDIGCGNGRNMIHKANYGNEAKFLNSIQNTFVTSNQTKIFNTQNKPTYVHNDWNNIKKNELSFKGSDSRLLRLKSKKLNNY